MCPRYVHPSSRFLSTPSARRATVTDDGMVTIDAYFYPRPPRGGRPNSGGWNGSYMRFLSTPSARRATPATDGVPLSSFDFYPRPPRGGRPVRWKHPFDCGKFLSTPSARRATEEVEITDHPFLFLSTPSARRATSFNVKLMVFLFISIHALREEGDQGVAGW